jgi:hypothetical protein
MLEQQFHERNEDADDSELPAARNAKRRKTGSNEEESPGLFGLVGGGSKKSKGGIGYAGDQKEDVRQR